MKQLMLNMTRAKKNPKLSHEQWVLIQRDNIKMIVELQQENESLKAEKKDLEAKEIELEGKLEKLKGKTWQLDAEEDNIKQRAKVEEVENLVSAKWLEGRIMELEEELECPVANDPPIFKCPDEHLICRLAVYNVRG